MFAWLGEGLTPWFGRYLKVISPDAVTVEFLETAGTTIWPYRKATTFGVKAKQDAHTKDEAADPDHEHAHEG